MTRALDVVNVTVAFGVVGMPVAQLRFRLASVVWLPAKSFSEISARVPVRLTP